MSSLLAQLSSAADVDYTDTRVPELDFSLWSLRAFKDAFEPRNPTDAATRTACMWLMYGSRRLWANIQHGRVFGRRGDERGVVLTKEMWDSWAESLRRLKEGCPHSGTINLMDEALESMNHLSGRPATNGSAPFIAVQQH